ncbi:MAG TPA: cupredoxin family copper-binding protein [Methanosarcina sp.]|jgi:plastocyanin|nr:cupredoxin family copper-binding protein [Methanosarcina sp.]
MRKELAVFIVLLGIFLVAGCTGNEPATPAETPEATPVETPVAPVSDVTPQPVDKGKIVEVDIQNSSFNPQSVEILTGDTVRWTNKDSIAHTVTGPTFDSKVLENGDTYEFLFTDAGTYNYKCSIHPSMKGTVVVAEKK